MHPSSVRAAGAAAALFAVHAVAALAAGAGTLLALGLPAAAHAQGSAAAGFPARPIRLVVPYGAGGVSDILGRTVAARMSELLGQNMVVDNRPGAGGIVGTEFVAKAIPDGYTIVLSSISVYSILPHMRKQMPFDPDSSLLPIGGIAQSSTIMSIGSGQPMKTVKEVLDRARAGKGKISYGSSGVGSVGHLTGEILGQLVGTELLHVPFKSAAAAYPDAINGTITMVIDSLPSAMQHLKAGTMRPLAMLSTARDPAMPDVPTIAEAGFPEAALVFWSGLHGPAGMPAPVVHRLADTLGRTLQTPEIRERFAALGALPLPMTGKELATRIRADRERLGKVMRAAGIQPE